MDIDIGVIVVNHHDSTSGSISLIKLLFWTIILTSHDSRSSSSSCMSWPLVCVGSHFSKLSILIKLLLIGHVSPMSSLNSVYNCRCSLTHSHLFLGILDEIILLCSSVQTFNGLQIDAILPFVRRNSSALPNLLRWFDQRRDPTKLIFSLTFWWLLHRSVNHGWILVENKAHFVRGYSQRFLCSMMRWILYCLRLKTATHFSLSFLLRVSLLCLWSSRLLLASKYPFKRSWIRFVICLMSH